MSIVAVFPLSLVRRACKYQSPVVSGALSTHPSCSHYARMNEAVYVIHADSGKTYRGV